MITGVSQELKMRRSGFVLVVLLSLAALSVMYFGASMKAQEAENVLLFSRFDEASQLTSLYTLNADTGEENLIAETENFHRAGWSPDGRIWVVDNVVWERDEGRFRFLDSNTGTEDVLSENIIINIDQCQPALLSSPDRQSLAYFTRTEDERILNIREGTDTRQYAMPFVDGEYLSHWSADGAYIHIVTAGQMDRLLSVEDGSEILRGQYIHFSPDNRFVSYTENETLWLYELETGEKHNLEFSGWIGAWLPGLIFIADNRATIWTYNLETRELSQLEAPGAADFIPVNPRYLLLGNYYGAGAMYLYDVQNESLTPLDLGYELGFASLSEDENKIFLYADFEESARHRLLSYDLATGESATIYETTGSIYSVKAVGDWLFIHYSPRMGDDENAIFLLSNQATGLELEVPMFYQFYMPAYFTVLSSDRRWLAVNTAEAVYLYDLNSNSSELEPLLTSSSGTYGGSASWSSDSRYMAFEIGGQAWLLNVETAEMTALPEDITIIDWKYAGQASVLLCNGAADGMG